jgi:hypothetical protein
MADKKGRGLRYPDAYNETDSSGPEVPDSTISYYTWDEVMNVHLQSADMESTSNSESGSGIMGSPAPGEPNPAGMTVLKGGK